MSSNKFQLSLETAAGVMTVTQGEPETLIEKLNRLAKECGFNNIPTYATHIIRAIDQPNGVQLLFNRTGDEPFTLTDPVANRIAEYRSNTINPVPEDFTGGVAVKRILFHIECYHR